MKTVVNLTPHTINVVADAGTFAYAASGIVARVASSQVIVGDVNGIPVANTIWGDVIDLPAPQADTIYLVSAMVLGALSGSRQDVYGPNTGAAIRNDAGQIIGVPGFQQ